MNIFPNRFYFIPLFFSIVLSVPLHSEHIYVKHSVFGDHSRGKDFSISKSSPDYSHDADWGNSGHRSSVRVNNFKAYDVQDFHNHFVGRGYTEKEILNQRCLYMFDDFVKFAQTYSSYSCSIKELHAVLKNLNIFQKAYYTLKGTYCAGLQKRIHYLYNELSTLKKQPLSKDPIIRDISLATHSAQMDEYATFNNVYHTSSPALSQAIEKRLDAYNNTSECMAFVRKSYNLNNNVTQLLSQYGHDTARFTQCYGNDFHHTIHQESINILDRLHSLPHSSVLYDHQEALVDFTVAMVDYNHEFMCDKAMTVGDLCWTLLDYGQAVAEGAAMGVYSAAHDLITNPLNTALCIVAGKEMLLFQLSKVVCNVADISVTALVDSKRAQQKWCAYTEPLNNIIDAIRKKEITLRDGIKSGTALAVGWRTQGKLLGGLGKFCNTIQKKSLNFIKNNPRLKPAEYVTTPEGLLFNAAAKSNKTQSSGSSNTASKLKDTIGSEVAKPTILSAIVTSGKEIICKGDLRAKIKQYELHIFSTKHIKKGLLAAGESKEHIMESLHDIIMSLDKKGLLKEGANQIKATINGIQNVEIKCFIQKGEAISIDAYISDFNRLYNNFIDTTKV